MRRDNFEKINLFRFVGFLRENPSFFKVWAGYSQSSIGSRFSMIARAVLFYQITKSPSAVAVFSIFPLLPFIITSPFTGVFYILAFLSGILSAFFSTAFYSIIPQTAKNRDDIVIANSLNNFSENLTEILGPFLGAIIVKFFGVIPAFIIDSLTFF